jgi:hypothetical protein
MMIYLTEKLPAKKQEATLADFPKNQTLFLGVYLFT